MVEFTGERVVPGEVDPDLWNEHLSRYVFAARLAGGKRVIDAGCGTGYGTAELARHAARVTGFDQATDAIAYARAHFQGPAVSFIQASCAALPLPASSADLIVAFEVIEHLEAWRDFLAEARRVLCASGILLVSTPNREYYADSRRLTGSNPYHVHEFDFAEFSSELRNAFPHVTMFLQNHAAGIAFQPCGEPRHFELAGAGSRPGSPEDAHFFLALCSGSPLPELPACVYMPATANVLRERERHIGMLEAEREQLRIEKQNLVEMFRNQKSELDASNEWARNLETELRAARKRILELQDSERELTDWALRLQSELAECARLVEEARERLAQLDRLRSVLAMARESRWLKLGRAFRLGPDLMQD